MRGGIFSGPGIDLLRFRVRFDFTVSGILRPGSAFEEKAVLFPPKVSRGDSRDANRTA